MVRKRKGQVAGFGAGIETEGGQVVDDPVGASGEQVGIGGGGAESKDASASSFAGARA